MHKQNIFVIIKVENITNEGEEALSNKTLKTLYVEKELCKGCGICVAFCPKNVLAIKDGKVEIENRCMYPMWPM